MNTISTIELNRERTNGATVTIIDVRTPGEYGEVHAEGARCLPLDRISQSDVEAACKEDGTDCAYIICKSGARAQQACSKLNGMPVVLVEGGTDAWVNDGLPVVRGKAHMSLERQVRIAAGSLVVIGVVLAATVHPYFVGLSGFVGAGLVFAGVTDTCAMGMLIAKMPWNQGPTASQN